MLHHILSPGAFRIVLAAMVVVSHTTRFDIGRLAVLLFFVLSGYWTSLIWDAKFGNSRTGWFFLARWLRIVPLYLVALVAAAWAREMELAPINLALLGVASAKSDPLEVAWSLDIELQFYLLLPLIIPLVRRAPVAALAASIAIAGVAWASVDVSKLQFIGHYLPAFVAGAVIHVIDWRPGRTLAFWSLGLFTLASTAALFTTFAYKGDPDPFHRDIFAFFWMLPLLPWVAASLRVKSDALDRHLGNISYPLYLVHVPVILVIAEAGGGAMKALAAAVALAIALLLYIAIDRPLDRWRIRATERRGPSKVLLPTT